MTTTSLQPQYKQSPPESTGRKASGTWTAEEHDRFLQGMARFPKGPWSAIADVVGTRSVRQVHSHAQKYAAKVERYQLGKSKLRRNQESKSSEPTTLSGHRVVPKILGKLVGRTDGKAKYKQKRAMDLELPAVATDGSVSDSSAGESWNDAPIASPSRRPAARALSVDSISSSPSSPSSVGGFQSLLLGVVDEPVSLASEDLDGDDDSLLPSLDESLDYFILQFGGLQAHSPSGHAAAF